MICTEYGLSTKPFLKIKDSPLYVGCEFEIENLMSSAGLLSSIAVTEDGSLRNNGREFITPAILIPEAIGLFKHLHDTLEYGDEAFSERTSIHVHANCCNLFPQEVRNIVLLYALFEESFFSMVDKSRRENIHCVALTETYLPSSYRSNCNNMIGNWHKYTALNLKPLTTQGTMEFRHMHGHADIQLFTEWLGIIEALFLVGRTFKVTAKTLEETHLKMLFDALFGNTRLKDKWDTQRSMMDNQIIDVKLSTI